MKREAKAPALVCDNVTVRFPLISGALRWKLLLSLSVDSWHEALSNVSFSIPSGKILGVIGHNGAGKSTLLRTLAGVHPLATGRVVRLGQISSLFELGGMGGFLITGREYVKQWLRLNDVPKADWKTIIEEIQEFSELEERFDDRIYTYSAGMAARLYFSTATSVGHEIYLIDEVLSVGDEHFQAKCWKRVRERLAMGVSGVLVTHDWSAILSLCEHACELENGKIVVSGGSEQVIYSYLNLMEQLDQDRPAFFSDQCPTSLRAVSGKDWFCDIPIDVVSDSQVFFDYSLEKLHPGYDWQILFLSSETLIASSAGCYKASINVADFPLPGGEYRLNLFLSGARPATGGTKPVFDMRSWTSGNSLKLYVEGDEEPALVKLPLDVEYL